MSIRVAWTAGFVMCLLMSGGCSESSKDTHDGEAGQGGSGGDASAGGEATAGAGADLINAAGANPGTAGGGGIDDGPSGAGGGVGGINGGSGGRGGSGSAGRANGGSGVGGGSGGTTGSGVGGEEGGLGGATGLGGVGGVIGEGGEGGAIGEGGEGGAIGEGGEGGGCVGPTAPAVERDGQYFDFTERFNRYYTDCAWQPENTVYVSPTGTGDGTSRTRTASVESALGAVVPGTMVVFTAGTYDGCYELDSERSGNYDSPIVLRGERNADGSPAAIINCCDSGRRTCINLEASDYVAVDGFELVGGDYGVRAVGAGYPADEHQKGIMVLGSVGHGQNKDPFFTGQSDWFVIERCTGYDSGSGDGHGIYLSNGSDWNIARYNETYNTVSSDFQINADPASTCADDGVDFWDPECDAVAGSSPTGGRGASDFMLIEGNFFHHSQAQGPNFTSVRNSTIKNNIFALPARHGASFWQETDNPALGSSNNLVAHNLFITQVGDRQAIGVTDSSTGNQFRNNVIVAVSISDGRVAANAGGQLLATDATTVDDNTFQYNAWISGYFGSDDDSEYTPSATELRLEDFDVGWFSAFPATLGHDAAAFAPTETAPWLDLGSLVPEVPTDRDGVARHEPVDLGPYER